MSFDADKSVCTQKVREVEVLKAAKDDSRKALLVYASDRAVSYTSEDSNGDLPPQLRVFASGTVCTTLKPC